MGCKPDAKNVALLTPMSRSIGSYIKHMIHGSFGDISYAGVDKLQLVARMIYSEVTWEVRIAEPYRVTTERCELGDN